MSKLMCLLCSGALLLILPAQLQGLTLPQRSDPGAGAVLNASPTSVSVWFDGTLENAFCSIRVQNGRGERVDLGDGHVDSSDETLLQAGLPPLPPGTYRVYWTAVGRDGHRTSGDHSFTVEY